MITYPTVRAGFQERGYGDQKHLLAYVTYQPEDKLPISLNNWRNKSIPISEYRNEPTAGYKIWQDVHRQPEYFGTGRTVFQVMHPEGFIFEIPAGNLLEILLESNVKNGVILDPCVLGFELGKVALIPCNSKLYQEAINNLMGKQASKINIKKIPVGAKVLLQRGTTSSEEIYYGNISQLLNRYWTLTESPNFRYWTGSSSEYQDQYNNWYDNNARRTYYYDKPRYWFSGGSLANPKVVKVIEENVASEQEIREFRAIRKLGQYGKLENITKISDLETYYYQSGIDKEKKRMIHVPKVLEDKGKEFTVGYKTLYVAKGDEYDELNVEFEGIFTPLASVYY